MTEENPLFGSTGDTLPPAPDKAIVVNVISGDYRKDCLLEAENVRWNSTSPVGTNTSLTYSFAAAAPSYGDASDANGFQAFSAEQQAVTRAILAKLAQQIGLDFREVSDSASSYGVIRFGNNNQASSSGYAYLPNTAGESSGDVYISLDYSTNVSPGSYNYAVLVHELGHAIGLKHPGNYNAGEITATTTQGNYLGVQDDKTILTIMSYRESVQGLNAEWFQPYDMLTLRYLYGTRAYNATDNTYSMTDANGQKLNSIIDDGGNDTIDLSALTGGATLNLTPGSISSLGKTSSGTAAVENLAIALDAVIENVVGSADADNITLNTANNRVTPGGGNDTVDGGAGIDQAIFSGARSLYNIAKNSVGYTISSAAEGVDSLTNVERFKFSDGGLAVDLSGNAGQTAKILGVIFGKESVSNPTYVGIGLNLLDGGMSYQDLMQAALNARLGAGFSSESEVNLLFQTLAGSPPSADALSYWTGAIATGKYSQASLAVLAADSDLNTANINLVGLADTGLAYA